MRSIYVGCYLFIFIALTYSCQSFKREKLLQAADSTVYTLHNYTPLIFDSAALLSFIEKDSLLVKHEEDILSFYRRRQYQAAWFDSSHLTEHAYTFLAKLHEYRDLYQDSALFSKNVCELEDSITNNPLYFYSHPEDRVWMDYSLTATFFKYADKEYYGIDETPRDLEWYIPRKKKNYLRLLEALADSDSSYQKYEPYNSYYIELKNALLEYKRISEQGGLPIIRNMLRLSVGTKEEGISLLKKYLALTGDYLEADSSDKCTDSLIVSIKSFQDRMGLTTSGQMDEATLKAMQVPIEDRMRTMMINLERLRWVPPQTPASYLMVNIPDYKLYVFDSNQLQWAMKVVVGKQANNTAIFSDELSWVVFSPYWNVPDAIFVKEMLPAVRRNPGYLMKHNMEVVSGNTIINPYSIRWRKVQAPLPFVVRERPGPNNSLGLIKFLFPNHFNIYMHDSPAKHLFSQDTRAFSHGCVRLAEPEKLAQYIFRKDSTVTTDSIQTWMNRGIQKFVRVKPAIPVYIVYFTSWVNSHGKLHFRPDVYKKDEKLGELIFGKKAPVI